MVHTFHCPACNAKLEYDGDDDPIVQCAYCNSAVIVPEDIRARPSTPPTPADWPPMFDNFFKLDLSDLTNQAMGLKAIKQLIHEGKEEETTRLYQEKFGVSTAEAEAFINSLASGQSVVFSNVTTFDSGQGQAFSAMFPTASGTAGSNTQVQFFTSPNINVEWVEMNQSQTKKGNPILLSVVILIIVMLLVIATVAILLLV